MGILGEGGAYGTDGGGQLEGFEDNDETGDSLHQYDDTMIQDTVRSGRGDTDTGMM